MGEGITQPDLIAQATGGDPLALEQLLLEHHAALSRHVARRLAGPTARLLSADDMVQETFIHAIRDIRNCHARTAPAFVAWLKAVADNRILDAVKWLKRKKRGGDRVRVVARRGPAGSMVELAALLSAGSQRPEKSVARHEAVGAVQIGIAGLPDDQREAVRLRHVAGKSIEETAAAMGRTPAAVRGLLHRANQALRQALVRSTLWFSRK